MTFSEVLDASGRPLSYEQTVLRYADNQKLQVTQATITLPRPLPSKGTTTVAVKWDGYLTPYTETGSNYVRDRIDTAFTIVREDARAFPSINVANRSVNRAAPRAEFEFAVRLSVPAHQVVAAGGRLHARREQDGLVTYEYRSTLPVTFLNVTAAPYRVLEQDGFRIYYFPVDSAGAQMVANAARNALGRMSSWFGPMAGKLDLAIMEIPDGFGSQASLGAGIIQTASAFRDRRQLGQLYHELSHLWNAPDRDSPSARWNEGLAELIDNLLTRDLDGWTSMDDHIQNYLVSYLPRFRSDSANLVTPLEDFGRTAKTDLSYSVGYFMFYVLYEAIGAEAFNRSMGGYYQKYQVKGGSLAQLIAYIQENVPFELDQFFDEWIHSTRWYDRVRAGETLKEMAARYRAKAAR
jgi:hypothetical protein